MPNHSSSGFTASDLAVIIPTVGREKQLKATLEALQLQSEPGFETIVVFDGTDLQLHGFESLRLLRQSQAGPGVARNRGVASTSRPLVLFLGDDMVPEREFVARHLEHHRAHPDAEIAVLGRVAWHPAVERNRLHRWLEWSGALFDFPTSVSEPDPDAGWGRFFSCNVSIKRELFEAAHGFDPDFVFDYEDLDLAWRLHQRGMRLIYEPRALTRHMHPYDWESVVRRYRSRARAERLMMSKHDWFQPWFYDQMTQAEAAPRASRLWTTIVDRIPPWPSGVRGMVRARADLYYRQQLAPTFFGAWAAAEPLVRQAEIPSGRSSGGPK